MKYAVSRLLIYLFVSIFINAHLCQGQGFSLDKIKEATRDSSDKYYYPLLVEEFISQPEYLSAEKGTYLYYGKLYSRYYKFFDFGKDAVQFDKFVQRQQIRKAIKAGEKLLEENPVNLSVLFKLVYCYEKDGQQDKALITRNKSADLLRAIESSGSGLSREEAYKVTSVTDEYILAGKLGLKGNRLKSERLDKAFLDVWQIKDPGSDTVKLVYFEVLYNYDAISK